MNRVAMTRQRNRRRFLASGLALAAMGLASGCGLIPPVMGRQAKVPRIGYVGNDAIQGAPAIEAFVKGFTDHGWVNGRNIIVEYRFVGGDPERGKAAVAELIDLNVDLVAIVTNTVAVQTAKASTSTIPILFVGVTDPVALGIVESVARPGGNITGVSDRGPGVAAKQVQLLTEAVPKISHLGILWHARNPSMPGLFREAQEMARARGLRPLDLGVDDGSAGQIEAAFARAGKEQVDGLCVINSGALYPARFQMLELAAKQALPAIYAQYDFVPAGGLMSYAANLLPLWYAAGGYVDKILKGAKPGDLPVQGPTVFDFVINLKTAQAQGLTIPQSVLAQATETIQ